MINETSNFPDVIDPMLFFMDIDLKHLSYIDNYYQLINQGKYAEAQNFINSQNNIFGFFAEYINLLENKIYNFQEYILNLPPIRNDLWLLVDANEPTLITDSTIWIE